MRFVKNTALLALLFSGEQLFAQAVAAAPAPAKDPNMFANWMGLIFGIVVGVVFVASLWAMVRTNTLLYKSNIRQMAEAQGIRLPEFEPKPEVAPGEDFWTRLRKKYWENPVPVEREGEILLAHGFDGIRELDNSLPPWWINMFYITIAWAVGYMIYFHWGGGGPSSREEYQQEMETAKKEIAMATAGKAASVDENTVVALTDASSLGEGELIFKANCVACHGQNGEGLVGPNFCDQNWIHGGGIKNIFKTIKNGVPDKGMISWAATLRPQDIQKVGSYILKFQGTNPPNQKAPQGEIWKE